MTLALPPALDAALGALPETDRQRLREEFERSFVAPRVPSLYADVLPACDNVHHAYGEVVVRLHDEGFSWASERWVRRIVVQGRRGQDRPRRAGGVSGEA